MDTPLTRDNPNVRPLLDQAEPLTAEDVARAVVYAYQQPERVLVSEITMRPAAPGAAAPMSEAVLDSAGRCEMIARNPVMTISQRR